MYSYTDLDVYNVAMNLVEDVYKTTAGFPKEEQFGLSAQMRRCAVSIPSNIAEGSGRQGTKEFIHFLYITNASLSELETQIEISRRLGYLDKSEDLIRSVKRIRVMVLNLIKTLNTKLENKN
jgi:four helix bundle protein